MGSTFYKGKPIDEMEEQELKAVFEDPSQRSAAITTQIYINDWKESMAVAGSIIDHLLAKQEEDRSLKEFKKLGKAYVARNILDGLIVAMRTASNYGDKHPETNMYDYAAEVEEPVPPNEPALGIKLRPKFQLPLEIVSQLDLESSLTRLPRENRSSRLKSYGRQKSGRQGEVEHHSTLSSATSRYRIALGDLTATGDNQSPLKRRPPGSPSKITRF